MAVYRYSAFAISIHSILRQKNKDRIELHVLLFCPGQGKELGSVFINSETWIYNDKTCWATTMSDLKLSMRKIMCRWAKIIKYVFVFDFIVVLKLSDTNEV
jgi:hypothetical protein